MSSLAIQSPGLFRAVFVTWPDKNRPAGSTRVDGTLPSDQKRKEIRHFIANNGVELAVRPFVTVGVEKSLACITEGQRNLPRTFEAS